MDKHTITHTFHSKFGSEPHLFQSPGRINLIGEHTDYNGGFVLPAAIDKRIVAALNVNGHASKIRLYALDLDEWMEFSLDSFHPLMPNQWPNYILGVVAQFLKKGIPLQGFDCLITGNIPLGAGLSSSAALESVVAYGLNELFSVKLERLELIRMAQLAEHEYAGVRCGIMDQFASVMGREDAALRLDCRSLEFDYFPLALEEYELLLINSRVRHSLASSEYNTRRLECEEGVKWIRRTYPEVTELRDVDNRMLEKEGKKMPKTIFQRCQFVVNENQRVLDACKALEERDLTRLGQLVFASHKGLSTEYEVSCPELDFLVDQAREIDFVLGARMMGGGFGGCSLNIVHKDQTDTFIRWISDKYQKVFGIEPEPIAVRIGNGSSAWQND